MNIDDGFKVSGKVDAYVFDGELDQSRLSIILSDRGQPEWERLVGESHSANLVSSIGRQQMTKLIVNETTVRVGYIALSTSTIVPAVTDLTLPSEKIRQALSILQSNLSYYQLYSAYFATGDFASTTITAAALNDTATTGGNQWADASITLSKTTAQSASVQWTVFISS